MRQKKNRTKSVVLPDYLLVCPIEEEAEAGMEYTVTSETVSKPSSQTTHEEQFEIGGVTDDSEVFLVFWVLFMYFQKQN